MAGPFNDETFLASVRQKPAPALRSGGVVMMGNLASRICHDRRRLLSDGGHMNQISHAPVMPDREKDAGPARHR